MFETTIEKDLQSSTSEAERQSLALKINEHHREEFLSFVEEIKQSGITKSLYDSSTPEETMSIWEKYSAENQDLFNRITIWAQKRDEYFDTYEPFPMFEGEEKLDFLLEIGLMIFIVKDECVLCDEDINESFLPELVELLKRSSNPILKAAGCYIDCNDFETITSENIYDFYTAD